MADETKNTEVLEMISADSFIKMDSANLEPVHLSNIPGFPAEQTILVKPLTQTERETLDETIWANVQTDNRGNSKVKSMRGYKTRAIHLSVITAKGKRMFTEQQAAALSSKVINYIFETVEEISGLKVEDMDDAAKK